MSDKKTILLVEDDSAITMGLEYSLSEAGFQVACTSGVKEAAQLLKQHSFDLALLDVTLPDGTGFDVCRTIKQKGDIPVIFLTACDDEGSVVLGLDMGADDYVTKPFRIRELLSRINSVLRRSGQRERRESFYKCGPIRLYPDRAKVFKGEEEIMLTALEYRILLTFLQNPGQVLTRNQLLDSIWDMGGEFVNDNTLTVYIKRLREKLEEDKADPAYILTVRGMGYRINDEFMEK